MTIDAMVPASLKHGKKAEIFRRVATRGSIREMRGWLRFWWQAVSNGHRRLIRCLARVGGSLGRG